MRLMNAVHECPAHDLDRHHGCPHYDDCVANCDDHDCRWCDETHNACRCPRPIAVAS